MNLCVSPVSAERLFPVPSLFNFYSQTDDLAISFRLSVAAAEPVKNNRYGLGTVRLVFVGNKDTTDASARENLRKGDTLC